VLWAAGIAAIVGLAAGGIASSHLTSSLSDYDARLSSGPGATSDPACHRREPGRRVRVWFARRPHRGRLALPSRVGAVVALLRARPEVKNVYDYAIRDSTMISGNGSSRSSSLRWQRAGEASRHSLQNALAAQPALKGNTWLGAHYRRRPDRRGVLSGLVGPRSSPCPSCSCCCSSSSADTSGRHAPRRRRFRHCHHVGRHGLIMVTLPLSCSPSIW